jgi:hypothetical protein
MRLSFRGFEVYNDDDGGLQMVIALAEADEQRTQRFYNLARTQQPQLSRVDRVESEDYTSPSGHEWQNDHDA